MILRQFCQIAPVLAAAHCFCPPQQLIVVDPAFAKCDLFQTRDLETLATLDRSNVVAGVEERTECPGIEPGKSSAKAFDTELATLQIALVDVGNFLLTPTGAADPKCCE